MRNLKIKKINKQKCLLDKATEISVVSCSSEKKKIVAEEGCFGWSEGEYKVRTLQKEDELKWRRESNKY